MPEEEFTLTPKQLAVLDLYAALRKLERNDVAEAVALQAVIDASKPGEASK
jgi:hypothetical protein